VIQHRLLPVLERVVKASGPTSRAVRPRTAVAAKVVKKAPKKKTPRKKR